MTLRGVKALKYEIKTANFVAEIDNDEQLTQLAKVGTIQKTAKLRMLPNGQWMPAKNLPLLQAVWGLVPAVKMPAAISSPENAGTGIQRLTNVPNMCRSSGGNGTQPPPPPSDAPDTRSSRSQQPSAQGASASVMSGPPRLETVVDPPPHLFVSDAEPSAQPDRQTPPVQNRTVGLDAARNDDAQKLAESMKSHDLEVLDALDIEIQTPSVDIEKDVVFQPLWELGMAQASERSKPSQVLESTVILADDSLQAPVVGSAKNSGPGREIVEAGGLDADDSSEDDSRTRTNWADDLPDVSEETVSTAVNPFLSPNKASSDETYASGDVALEKISERVDEIRLEESQILTMLSDNPDMTRAHVAANRELLGEDGIRRHGRVGMGVSDMDRLELAKTTDASALREERTTHDVKLLNFFMDKARTKPVVAQTDLADELYEEEATRERSHVDEARLMSFVHAVRGIEPDAHAEHSPQTVSAHLVSSTFEAIVQSQINAVLEDNHQAYRDDRKSGSCVDAHDGKNAQISSSDASNVDDDSASDELDESVSEQFTIHSREELEAMMRAFSEQEKMIQRMSGDSDCDPQKEIEDEPSSSERLRFHKRLDLKQVKPSNLGESDLVSVQIPIMARSIPPVQAGELRSLFEKEDELHILLANEIRTVESNCHKEAQKDEAANVRSKRVDSHSPDKKTSAEPSIKSQDTVITSASGNRKNTEILMAGLLHHGEKQVAKYGSFILTNRNIWNIEKSKSGIKNYESYDLANVQWFALREEHHWLLIILDMILCLIAAGIGLAFYEKGADKIFYTAVFFGGWGVLMLPVLYYMGYKTTLQIGVGSTVVKSRERIPRCEHFEAAKFLERLDRERIRIQKHSRKSK